MNRKLWSKTTRIEVWFKNKIRLAVNSGKKTFFTAKLPHLQRWMLWKRWLFEVFSGEIFFSHHSPNFLQKRNCRTRVWTCHLLHVNNFLFHCPTFHLLKYYFLWINFIFTPILLLAVKNFVSPLKQWKIIFSV